MINTKHPKLKEIKGLKLIYNNGFRFLNVKWFNPVDEKYIKFLFNYTHFPQYKKLIIEE